MALCALSPLNGVNGTTGIMEDNESVSVLECVNNDSYPNSF